MSSITLSLIQTELEWENKELNLKKLHQRIADLRNPQVVILPEMFSTGFSMQPSLLAETMEGETIKWMKNVAKEKKIILTGSVIIEEGGQYFNRLIWMQPNGQFICYDKRHLFAYAKEDQYYTPGVTRTIASVNGWKINLLVCYDLRFPVWSRQQISAEGEPEYDVLIYVANWPEKRSTAWKTLLKARAIENQCYVIGVNRVGTDGNGFYHSGNSTILDPLGEELYHKEKEEDTFTITLQKEELQEVRKKFPFLQDADDFQIKI